VENKAMNESLQRRTDRIVWIVASVFLVMFAGREVFASPPPSVSALSSALDAYRTECGACHVAYPPRLLPPTSWQALMRGLDNHFGVDASLDASTASSITTFLEQTAASNRRDARPRPAVPLRITETAWFQHEHDEIPSTVWQRKSVGSRANCAACHAGAEQGRFNERDVRIPN
jgi:hypothetical protein